MKRFELFPIVSEPQVEANMRGVKWTGFNSLALGRCDDDFRNVIAEYILLIKLMSISCEIVLRLIPKNTFDDLCLNQCWSNSLSPHGITKPQWVIDRSWLGGVVRVSSNMSARRTWLNYLACICIMLLLDSSSPMSSWCKKIRRALQWRHNKCDGVSNHQPYDRVTIYSGADQRKLQRNRVTGLSAGNSPMTGEFPAQKARDAETLSIWLHHHGYRLSWTVSCRDLMLRIPPINNIQEEWDPETEIGPGL